MTSYDYQIALRRDRPSPTVKTTLFWHEVCKSANQCSRDFASEDISSKRSAMTSLMAIAIVASGAFLEGYHIILDTLNDQGFLSPQLLTAVAEDVFGQHLHLVTDHWQGLEAYPLSLSLSCLECSFWSMHRRFRKHNVRKFADAVAAGVRVIGEATGEPEVYMPVILQAHRQEGLLPAQAWSKANCKLCEMGFEMDYQAIPPEHRRADVGRVRMIDFPTRIHHLKTKNLVVRYGYKYVD